MKKKSDEIRSFGCTDSTGRGMGTYGMFAESYGVRRAILPCKMGLRGIYIASPVCI